MGLVEYQSRCEFFYQSFNYKKKNQPWFECDTSKQDFNYANGVISLINKDSTETYLNFSSHSKYYNEVDSLLIIEHILLSTWRKNSILSNDFCAINKYFQSTFIFLKLIFQASSSIREVRVEKD